MSVYSEPLSPAERGDIELQQRDILLQNQQQREDLERNAELRTSPQISISTPEVQGPRFLISQINIEQAMHLPEKEKNQLVQPYINQCIGISQISKLVEDISEWYISRGYITSRAFLTEQDLSSGELNIRVLEGKLEKVLLEGESTTALRMAFPGLEGNIFNLRDIEQGMEQINRVRTVPVQIEILPGSEQGLSVVNLSATPEFPLSFTLGFDNSGQKSTGTGQMNSSVTGNNLLGIADKWFVNGAKSSDLSNSHDAQSLQASLSVPYGYALFDYSYSWSDYLSSIDNRGYYWRSRGDTQTHRLNSSWTLYRDGDIKTGLSLGITHRISRNYLNDVLLQSSSRKLSSVTVGINHGQKLWGGFATLNPAYSQGVPWLGAEDDDGKPSGAPKAEFSKWSLSGSYYFPLSERVTWLSSVYGQWTPDRLYGSERLTIGGESSVRGFKEQYLAGDSGGYLRNELNTYLFTMPVMGQVSLVTAVDGGYLHHDSLDKYASGTLWGAAVGLSTAHRHVSSSFTVSKPLKYPDWLEPDRYSVYYRIGLMF
ncbi:ShlB/FhaC/HecB family hemolysin secretion/activation protein [Jinshanibacter sp. LJY008]|uniref:ShlB/FhaC/HecB family hemolysin secretion/activation protein n=1 Tax=Limnobaculum eriocheiris TaxID=2897391 RepID=A0A9X1MZL7_9GAMM|nr:ShlB/FhaC/HecB family hemolysin secretion/activation protein [Limnobaculum eriocheiris]MCD1127727.1 ShlB/FhaC/HecB family hemolysin secretion/activation protein [Limnobaculum eriocheiris]